MIEESMQLFKKKSCAIWKEDYFDRIWRGGRNLTTILHWHAPPPHLPRNTSLIYAVLNARHPDRVKRKKKTWCAQLCDRDELRVGPPSTQTATTPVARCYNRCNYVWKFLIHPFSNNIPVFHATVRWPLTAFHELFNPPLEICPTTLPSSAIKVKYGEKWEEEILN